MYASELLDHYSYGFQSSVCQMRPLPFWNISAIIMKAKREKSLYLLRISSESTIHSLPVASIPAWLYTISEFHGGKTGRIAWIFTVRVKGKPFSGHNEDIMFVLQSK